MPSVLAALLVGWSVPLHAQIADWVNEILTAARLPVVTAEARREGVTSDDIRAVLEAMGRARLPAHEATAVIDTVRATRREHGPVDNFGAFVQAQLAAGRRGRDLAAAIREEHARSGRGRGNAARGAPDQGRGKADTGRGRRGDAQPSRGRGRGDTTGTSSGDGARETAGRRTK